jgi:hypothetical protein
LETTTTTPKKANPINNLKQGARIKMQGVLKAAKLNSGGGAILFLFIEPHQPGKLRGIAYKANYKDEFDIKKFEPFIGKQVSLEGLLSTDETKEKFVEITNLNQISLKQ